MLIILPTLTVRGCAGNFFTDASFTDFLPTIGIRLQRNGRAGKIAVKIQILQVLTAFPALFTNPGLVKSGGSAVET